MDFSAPNETKHKKLPALIMLLVLVLILTVLLLMWSEGLFRFQEADIDVQKEPVPSEVAAGTPTSTPSRDGEELVGTPYEPTVIDLSRFEQLPTQLEYQPTAQDVERFLATPASQ